MISVFTGLRGHCGNADDNGPQELFSSWNEPYKCRDRQDGGPLQGAPFSGHFGVIFRAVGLNDFIENVIVKGDNLIVALVSINVWS